MIPHKKGKKYEITYRDPDGKLRSERFDSEKEAILRASCIELMKEQGTFTVTSLKSERLTVNEVIDRFLEEYAAVNWKSNYYANSIPKIDNYIRPAFGNKKVKDVSSKDLTEFYNGLLTTPAVNSKKEYVTASVIERIRVLMHTILQFAKEKEYIDRNPDDTATSPKYHAKERAVWTIEEAQDILRNCKNDTLKMCMFLSINLSGRIGEILGLQWCDVKNLNEESINNGKTFVRITKQLARLNKDAQKKITNQDNKRTYEIFEGVKEDSKSFLALVDLKTDSSVRDVYLTKTVGELLLEYKQRQNLEKIAAGETYQDYDLIIAQPNGRPYEERLMDRMFKKYLRENGYPDVVFHSTRHLSTQIKLKASSGDIKAVQKETGHATPKMVTEQYSDSYIPNKQKMADEVEKMFFAPQKKESDVVEKAISYLREDPKLAELIVSIFERQRIC